MSFTQPRIVAIACIMLGAAAASAGQPWVSPRSGFVRDHASGRALAGVLVTVLDTDGKESQSTSTDSTGAYWFRSIGKATVIYSLPGYETLQINYPEDLQRPGECGCTLKDVSLRLLI